MPNTITKILNNINIFNRRPNSYNKIAFSPPITHNTAFLNNKQKNLITDVTNLLQGKDKASHRKFREIVDSLILYSHNTNNYRSRLFSWAFTKQTNEVNNSEILKNLKQINNEFTSNIRDRLIEECTVPTKTSLFGTQAEYPATIQKLIDTLEYWPEDAYNQSETYNKMGVGFFESNMNRGNINGRKIRETLEKEGQNIAKVKEIAVDRLTYLFKGCNDKQKKRFKRVAEFVTCILRFQYEEDNPTKIKMRPRRWGDPHTLPTNQRKENNYTMRVTTKGLVKLLQSLTNVDVTDNDANLFLAMVTHQNSSSKLIPGNKEYSLTNTTQKVFKNLDLPTDSDDAAKVHKAIYADNYKDYLKTIKETLSGNYSTNEIACWITNQEYAQRLKPATDSSSAAKIHTEGGKPSANETAKKLTENIKQKMNKKQNDRNFSKKDYENIQKVLSELGTGNVNLDTDMNSFDKILQILASDNKYEELIQLANIVTRIMENQLNENLSSSPAAITSPNIPANNYNETTKPLLDSKDETIAQQEYLTSFKQVFKFLDEHIDNDLNKEHADYLIDNDLNKEHADYLINKVHKIRTNLKSGSYNLTDMTEMRQALNEYYSYYSSEDAILISHQDRKKIILYWHILILTKEINNARNFANSTSTSDWHKDKIPETQINELQHNLNTISDKDNHIKESEFASEVIASAQENGNSAAETSQVRSEKLSNETDNSIADSSDQQSSLIDKAEPKQVDELQPDIYTRLNAIIELQDNLLKELSDLSDQQNSLNDKAKPKQVDELQSDLTMLNEIKELLEINNKEISVWDKYMAEINTMTTSALDDIIDMKLNPLTAVDISDNTVTDSRSELKLGSIDLQNTINPIDTSELESDSSIDDSSDQQSSLIDKAEPKQVHELQRYLKTMLQESNDIKELENFYNEELKKNKVVENTDYEPLLANYIAQPQVSDKNQKNIEDAFIRAKDNTESDPYINILTEMSKLYPREIDTFLLKKLCSSLNINYAANMNNATKGHHGLEYISYILQQKELESIGEIILPLQDNENSDSEISQDGLKAINSLNQTLKFLTDETTGHPLKEPLKNELQKIDDNVKKNIYTPNDIDNMKSVLNGYKFTEKPLFDTDQTLLEFYVTILNLRINDVIRKRTNSLIEKDKPEQVNESQHDLDTIRTKDNNIKKSVFVSKATEPLQNNENSDSELSQDDLQKSNNETTLPDLKQDSVDSQKDMSSHNEPLQVSTHDKKDEELRNNSANIVTSINNNDNLNVSPKVESGLKQDSITPEAAINLLDKTLEYLISNDEDKALSNSLKTKLDQIAKNVFNNIYSLNDITSIKDVLNQYKLKEKDILINEKNGKAMLSFYMGYLEKLIVGQEELRSKNEVNEPNKDNVTSSHVVDISNNAPNSTTSLSNLKQDSITPEEAINLLNEILKYLSDTTSQGLSEKLRAQLTQIAKNVYSKSYNFNNMFDMKNILNKYNEEKLVDHNNHGKAPLADQMRVLAHIINIEITRRTNSLIEIVINYLKYNKDLDSETYKQTLQDLKYITKKVQNGEYNSNEVIDFSNLLQQYKLSELKVLNMLQYNPDQINVYIEPPKQYKEYKESELKALKILFNNFTKEGQEKQDLIKQLKVFNAALALHIRRNKIVNAA